jgi:hypothetical protein
MSESSKYERLRRDLEETGRGAMKCFGPSMRPILPDPSVCHYVRQADYGVGDIVFAKVRGRWIDAHRITKVAADGRYLISNNHGHDNGWTRQVFGRVVRAVDALGRAREF